MGKVVLLTVHFPSGTMVLSQITWFRICSFLVFVAFGLASNDQCWASCGDYVTYHGDQHGHSNENKPTVNKESTPSKQVNPWIVNFSNWHPEQRNCHGAHCQSRPDAPNNASQTAPIQKRPQQDLISFAMAIISHNSPGWLFQHHRLVIAPFQTTIFHPPKVS